MLYSLLEKFFCSTKVRVYEANLRSMESNLKVLQERIALYDQETQDLVSDIEDGKAQIKLLEDERIKLVLELRELQNKLAIHPRGEYWDNKYPVALVQYEGRYLPDYREGAKLVKINWPVQLFVNPNDPIIVKDIKRSGLMIRDPLKCDEDIVRIYKHTRTKTSNPYRYSYDEPRTGVNELWYLTPELREVDSADCDDWGIELCSYLRSAGLPAWRVRCVAGYTWGGIGHLTVYVLGDDLDTWYHINSTTPIHMFRNKTTLSEFPVLGDDTDDIGIKDIWFSFNDINAWSVFKTDSAEKTFKKKRDGFLKKIKIDFS